jgi:site-specific recombinase XerD
MKRNIIFHSALAKPLAAFVSLQQASGSDYFSQAYLLMRFDRFIVTQHRKTKRITPYLFNCYVATCEHMKPRSKDNCLCVVRQFCHYLKQSQPHCYIPIAIAFKRHSDNFQPWVLTSQQVSTVLALAEQLPPQQSLRPDTSRALLALLYTTGIRVGEALALNLDDIDFTAYRIHIKRGKYRKARWIYMSVSLENLFVDYIKRRMGLDAPITPDAPLFISLRKTRLSHSALTVTFHTLCDLAAITQEKKKPRLMDLRHSFATNRLLQWYEAGEDVQAKLPVLATHMGHVDLYSTQVYIHSLPQLLAIVGDNFHSHYQKQIIKGGV